MTAQAQTQVGAEIAAQEPDQPEPTPLLHVHGLVPGELLVTGPPSTHADNRTQRDCRRARRHGPADHAPVVGRPLDVHLEELRRELLAPVGRTRVLRAEKLE